MKLGGYEWVDGTEHNSHPGHEASFEPVFRELLGDGVFLDIGAHVGLWTIRMAGQARKVISVEANPGTADILRQNVVLNGFNNVTVIEAAAWDSNARLRLDDPTDRECAGTNRTLPDRRGVIRGQKLDDLLVGEKEITFLKMDVEGADLHVLRGLRETLGRCKPTMFVERHDNLGYYREDELFQTLTDLNYKWRDGPFWEGIHDGPVGFPHLICTPIEE